MFLDISKAQEVMLKNAVFRRLTLFCIFYVATRDILISIMLTTIFVILQSCFLHEESLFCVLPKSVRNSSSPITEDEYMMAKKTVDMYESSLKKPEKLTKE
jgi:hypothetical protein